MSTPLAQTPDSFVDEIVWRSDGKVSKEQVARGFERRFGTVQRAFEFFSKYRDPKTPFVDITTKPGPGETVMVYPLGREDGVRIRLYGDDKVGDTLQSYQCLDFIDRNGMYIKKPDDIKIHKNPKGDGVSAEFFTFEDAIAEDRAWVKDYELAHGGPRDPNFETYLVREGYIIDVKQEGKKTLCIQVPIGSRARDTEFITPLVTTL